MPIEFRCTSCGKLLRVKDDAAGKQAKCPACETVSQVPTAPPPPSAAPGEPPPAAATPPPASESENPYLSPEIQFDPSGRPVLPDEARRKVSTPATALIVVGVIGLVFHAAMLLLLYLVPGEWNAMELPGLQNNPFMQALAAHQLHIQIIVAFVRSLLIIFGGMQMKKLANYPLVMTASIVAIVPCFSGCYCLDLPFGIWALVVISGASVRGSFNRAASAM